VIGRLPRSYATCVTQMHRRLHNTHWLLDHSYTYEVEKNWCENYIKCVFISYHARSIIFYSRMHGDCNLVPRQGADGCVNRVSAREVCATECNLACKPRKTFQTHTLKISQAESAPASHSAFGIGGSVLAPPAAANVPCQQNAELRERETNQLRK
jgi:hypothetical protein